MPLLRLLLRLVILIAGAILGLGLFLFAVVAFAVLLIVSLLRGRKPQMQFRMNKNPWAQRRAGPAAEDVVDIEAREVKDAPPPPPATLPLQAPQQQQR